MTPDKLLSCDCNYSHYDGVRFCPLHATAPALLHRLQLRVAFCGCTDNGKWPDLLCQRCRADQEVIDTADGKPA